MVQNVESVKEPAKQQELSRASPDARQALLRHKSYQKTEVYLNRARQMDQAVASLHVPEVLRLASRQG